MISVSTTYNNIISGGGHYEWQVLNGSNTWTKENIMSGSVSSTLFDGVSIGNTISTQLDIELWSVTVDTTNPLILQFRAVSGSSQSTWYTKGTFFIDTLETSPYSEVTKITAFDAMLKAEYPYQISGTWTATTDLIVLNRIASDIGVAVDSATATLFSNNPRTLSASPNIGSDGTTEREMLSYIGAMRGGNWFIDASNKLKLIILSTSPSNTANIGDAVSDFDAAPTETVKRVKVWVSDDTYYAFPELPLQTHVPENIQTQSLADIAVRAWQFPEEWDAVGGRVIDVKIPFFCTYSIAKAIYTQFVNKTYQPYNTNKAFIQPEYEVGDGITVKGITSIIADQTIDISAIAPSSVQLRKDEAINSLYPYKDPFRRKTDYQVSRNAQQIATNTQQIAENTEKVNALPDLIDQQTTLITGGFGGYIKYTYLSDGTPSEMLIMDTPSESTATNIIRLNRNGIGFSTDGGATYGTAWTIDGKFNANYIQTGTLSADRIGANSIAVSKLTGSISNGGWSINLDNGTMTLGTLAVGSITGNIANGNWKIDFDNGSFTIGNISAENITTGTLDAARIGANTIAISKLTDAAQAALMTSSSSKTQYYLSTSASSATGGSWSDTVPTWTSGHYVWTRVSTTKTFADGTSSTTTTTEVYDRAVTTALSTASSASTAASNAQTAADGANYREQIIYHSAASGTTSMAANTTWVTASGNTQNAWTTRRPVYSSNYPVLFVATQRQTVSQSGGTTCACTTPVIDQTTTVIDGGHITTGSIDASLITVGTLSGITISGNTITGGTISGTTITSEGIYSTGWNGVTTIYNGTFQSVGTDPTNQYSATMTAEGTGIELVAVAGTWEDHISIITEPTSIGAILRLWSTDNGNTTNALSLSPLGISSSTNISINGTVTGNNNLFKTPALTGVTDVDNTSLIGYFFAQASAVSNLPTSNAGQYYFVICEGTVQRAIRYGNTGALGEFVRYYTNNRWYPWIKMSEGILSTYAPSTLSGLNSNLVGAIGDMAYPQKRTVWINQSASITPFGTTKFFVDIYKQNDSYAVLKAYQVSGAGSGCYEYRASYYNGSINTWVSVS